MIDHDQISKTIIELFFQEFMELFCPEHAAQIDFDSVSFLKQEHFDDLVEGKRTQLDVVAEVRLKEGDEEFILVHTENEASRKDADFPQRMYLYYAQLFQRYRKTIIPIAFFTDDAKWRKDVPDFFEISMPSKRFLRFDYHLIKLKNHDYRGFLRSNNPLAFALMAKMDYNARERVRLKADFLRLILGARVDPARKNVLIEYVETYMPLSEGEAVEFEQIVTEHDYEEVKAMVTTYEQQGIEKGIEKGIEQGIERGERETLITQIERRFGDLDASRKEKILHELEQSQVKSLLLAVLDAESISDLGI